MIEVITVKQATYQTWLDSGVVSSIFLQYLSFLLFFFLLIMQLSLLHIILQFLEFQRGPSLSESSFCTKCYSLTLFAE